MPLRLPPYWVKAVSGSPLADGDGRGLAEEARHGVVRVEPLSGRSVLARSPESVACTAAWGPDQAPPRVEPALMSALPPDRLKKPEKSAPAGRQRRRAREQLHAAAQGVAA